MQGKRFAVEFRCPYCLTLSTVRKTIMTHIITQHKAEVQMWEESGAVSASSRVYNLSRAGVRVVEEERVKKHLDTLKSELNKRQLKIVSTVVKRCLLEALVIFGDEDAVSPSNFKDIKAMYQKLLK